MAEAPIPSARNAFTFAESMEALRPWYTPRALASAIPSSCLCVPKTKSERIDDEARPGWRAKLWRRIAEPGERPAHPFAKTDAF